MPKASPELEAITKTYDLVVWSANHVAKFPRAHKFTLGDRLQMRQNELIELLIRAKYTRERESMLRDANLSVELLRFQFRMAKDLKCLSVDSYGYAAKALNEIGRLIGGWIKASVAPTGRASSKDGKDAATQPPVGRTDQFPQSPAGRTKGPAR